MRRSEEEAAAYFAWKRGEATLGAKQPEYVPPDPDTVPLSSSTSSTDNNTPHLFDKLGLDTEPERERVDIDSIDVDDQSPSGRERRMQAMADELEGFSAGQRRDAERSEDERAKASMSEGRRIMDHFGQRFEKAPRRR